MKPLRASAGFARDLIYKKTEPRWLSLIGNSGTGKTHLAKGIWKGWEGKGQYFERGGITMVKHGLFKSYSKMCNEMRSGAFGIFQSCADADFLVLDDLGAEYCCNVVCPVAAEILEQGKLF